MGSIARKDVHVLGAGRHTAYQKLPLPLYKLSGMAVVTAE